MKGADFREFLIIFLAVLAAEFAFKALSQNWPPIAPT